MDFPLEEFSNKLADIVKEYVDKIPLHLLAKVLANHQIDLLALHAEALFQHRDKPAPES